MYSALTEKVPINKGLHSKNRTDHVCHEVYYVISISNILPIYGVVLNSPFFSSLTSNRAKSGMTGGREITIISSRSTKLSLSFKLNFSDSKDESRVS